MTRSFAWVLLVTSGLIDVAWALSMKYAQGYTKPLWTAVSLALLAAFVTLLGKSLQVLEVGTAYAVWTGIGAVGSVLLGAMLFGEALTLVRLGAIGLIVVGIVALKVTSG